MRELGNTIFPILVIKPLVMITLNVSWEEFQQQVQIYIKNLEKLGKEITSKIEYEKLNEEYDSLRNEILDFAQKTINNDTFFQDKLRIKAFMRYRINEFEIQTHHKINELKQDIISDHSHLIKCLGIISVCDFVVKPNKVDQIIRQNYTTQEILDLLIDKLFELYSDEFFPVLPILEGNGITLKRTREEFELVQILNQNGYVNTTGITAYADARLTLEGKIYVEEKRKVHTTDYSYVGNDKEQLFEKLDEILQEVQKNNLGNEILFEEIEELKFAYDKLSKKNWGQLFKGKMVDLVVGQVINEELAKRIFQEIANMPLYLK